MAGAASEGRSAREVWTRGFFMLLFLVIFELAEILLIAVTVFQFGSMLLNRRVSRRLLALGEELGEFVREVVRYLTYRDHRKPFPFRPWPEVSRERP